VFRGARNVTKIPSQLCLIAPDLRGCFIFASSETSKNNHFIRIRQNLQEAPALRRPPFVTAATLSV